MRKATKRGHVRIPALGKPSRFAQDDGPRYRDVKSSQIPEVPSRRGEGEDPLRDGNGLLGPVRDIVTDPEYLDVTVPGGTTFTHFIRPGQMPFAYVIEGKGTSTQTGIPMLMK